MGNDNMVQNQKVFIRLERVLAFQRLLIEAQTDFNKHSAATKRDGSSKEAYTAMLEAMQQLHAIRQVIELLELPITL
jgi:hypothetical protein